MKDRVIMSISKIWCSSDKEEVHTRQVGWVHVSIATKHWLVHLSTYMLAVDKNIIFLKRCYAMRKRYLTHLCGAMSTG